MKRVNCHNHDNNNHAIKTFIYSVVDRRIDKGSVFPLFNSLRLGDAYMCQYTNRHWFRQWLVAWPVPSHCLNQCWNIVNWTLRNKLKWNINKNSYIFIQENTFENVVRKMAALLSRPQCANWGICLYCLSLAQCYDPWSRTHAWGHPLYGVTDVMLNPGTNTSNGWPDLTAMLAGLYIRYRASAFG